MAVACACASLSPVTGAGTAREHRLAVLPRTMLWAWERPEDLRDLPPGTGVAFLAQIITIDTSLSVSPRRHPLRVDPSVSLMAVTRIETPLLVGPGFSRASKRTVLTPAETQSLVSAIRASSALPGVRSVQLDFDATESQRALYLQMLRDIRRGLREDVPLSMTALASWCAGDRWLDDAAVDETVPMLFRMGPATAFLKDAAASSGALDDKCRTAIGASLDEPVTVVRQNRRVYVFNPVPWTPATLKSLAIVE